MASIQVTLGATASVIPLDAPTQRIIVTMVSSPAEASFSVDGTAPAIPTSTENATAERTLAPVVGAQICLQPPLLPNGPTPVGTGCPGASVPVVRAISSGTPVVLLEW